MRLSFSFYNNTDLAIGARRINDIYNYYTENSNKIFVGVNGSTGKLGSKIKNLINEKNTTYVFNNISRDIDYKLGVGNNVIIDVSTPEGTKKLIEYLLSKNYVEIEYPEIYKQNYHGTLCQMILDIV